MAHVNHRHPTFARGHQCSTSRQQPAEARKERGNKAFPIDASHHENETPRKDCRDVCAREQDLEVCSVPNPLPLTLSVTTISRSRRRPPRNSVSPAGRQDSSLIRSSAIVEGPYLQRERGNIQKIVSILAFSIFHKRSIPDATHNLSNWYPVLC